MVWTLRTLLLSWTRLPHKPSLRRTSQIFALFFLLAPFLFFSLSLGVFSLNFGRDFEGLDLQHVWLSCEASGPPGSSHDSPRTQNVRGSRCFKNTTKIPRGDTQRDTERAKMVAGEGKTRNFGLHPSPPPTPPPPPSGPHLFWVSPPSPRAVLAQCGDSPVVPVELPQVHFLDEFVVISTVPWSRQ